MNVKKNQMFNRFEKHLFYTCEKWTFGYCLLECLFENTIQYVTYMVPLYTLYIHYYNR